MMVMKEHHKWKNQTIWEWEQAGLKCMLQFVSLIVTKPDSPDSHMFDRINLSMAQWLPWPPQVPNLPF